MIISGTYPILSKEDRSGLCFHKYTHAEKARILRKNGRKFAKTELFMYFIIMICVCLISAFPQYSLDFSYIIFGSLAVLGFLSIKNRKDVKKQQLSYIYTNMILLKKEEEYEPNSLFLNKAFAVDKTTGYETYIYMSKDALGKLEPGDEFIYDIDNKFLNYTPVEVSDTFKDTVYKTIF